MKTTNIFNIKNFKKAAALLLASAALLGGATACHDESEYVYPNELHTFGPCPVLRGQTIEIIGSGMNGLSKVIFPVDVEVTDFVSKSDTKVVVTVPQEALPGHLRLIINGKEIETKSIITYAEPISIESVSTPSETLNAGDIITVTGDYVYNIATVTFGNNAVVEAEDFVSQTRKELKVAVPAAAKSGKIVFSDGADWEESTDKVYTVSTATASALSKTDLDEGDAVTIYGTHLNLVKRVLFPGDIEVPFTIAEDGKSIETACPVGTCSGPINLELYSLDKVATPEFAFPTVTYKKITPNKDVKPGDELYITGTLLNRVKEIRFPGGEVMTSGWTTSRDGKQIIAVAPASMVDGKIQLVQNDNIIVETGTVKMVKQGNTFWVGSVELGNWATNLEVASDKDPDIWDAFSKTVTVPGQLTIEFTEDSSMSWWQIKPVYRSDWATCFVNVRDDNGGIHEMEEGQTSWTINITQEDIDALFAAGWAFSGCNLTITSMSFTPSK